MEALINHSIGNPREWQDGDLTFTELIFQEYSNCRFSAGMVSGHPVDNVYIQLERDGIVTTLLLFRPDELAALAWLATGVMWSLALTGDL